MTKRSSFGPVVRMLGFLADILRSKTENLKHFYVRLFNPKQTFFVLKQGTKLDKNH